jgi:ubiquinol-cytochrome c reductase iron-sulfur subunit
MSGDNGFSRRRFLAVATSITGAVGAVAATIPFISSWQPSARARALGAPIEVDLSKLEEGSMMRVIWRGQPISILYRSPDMLDRLANSTAELSDPDSEVIDQQPEYAANATRSVKPEYLIVVSNCTHLGCVPVNRFEVAPADLGPDWVGGFFCPCHGSKFDLAGRVYAGKPAPTNLVVPPHRYIGDTTLMIGEDSEVAA